MIKRVDWTRRAFLRSGIGLGGYAVLGGLPISVMAEDGAASLAGKVLNLVMRYRTDPERVARVLPPGLEPDDTGDVMLDWWVNYPKPGEENIYYPATYSECGIHVTAKHQGRRGMLQVGMPLDQDWGRTMGRENVGLSKKDGVLGLRRNGREITGELRRRGKLLYRIKTQLLDEPAHPLYWHRETGFGAFLYRYRLNPDWRQGPFGDEPVELWLRVLAGKRGVYPDVLTPSAPRACDFAHTEFEFVDPSALDPFCEFPLRQIVGMSYSETGLGQADAAAYRSRAPRTPTQIERLQFIDSKAFEPWALLNYDRPITRGRAWVPVGWPETATAMKLSSEELQQYRARSSLDLELSRCLDIRWQIEPAIHVRTLPPQLQAGAQPLLRIMALRVGTNDVSTESFNELWLMSRCESEGAEAWYALSHIVAGEGDVVHGRETFGYPSKLGTIDWKSVGKEGETVLGQRMGRGFVRMQWSGGGRVGTANNLSLKLVGLRLHPQYRLMTLTGFTEPGAQAELIAQPWSLHWTEQRLLGKARVEFPAQPAAGRIGATDPWFEFAQGKLISAHVGVGLLRRQPARRLGMVPNYQPYYAERYDGAFNSEESLSGKVSHTFLSDVNSGS
jgi:acetoacetate decarboxylase